MESRLEDGDAPLTQEGGGAQAGRRYRWRALVGEGPDVAEPLDAGAAGAPAEGEAPTTRAAQTGRPAADAPAEGAAPSRELEAWLERKLQARLRPLESHYYYLEQRLRDLEAKHVRLSSSYQTPRTSSCPSQSGASLYDEIEMANMAHWPSVPLPSVPEAARESITTLTTTGDPPHSVSGMLFKLDQVSKVKIKDTIWEASIFIGAPHVTRASSIIMTITAILNVFCQITFCIVVKDNFLEHPFEEALAHDSYKHWRINDGQNLGSVSPASFITLAARVCNHDKSLSVGSDQATVLEAIEKYQESYTGSLSVGFVFAILACLIWASRCCSELWEAAYFLEAVLQIKIGEQTSYTAEGGFRTISARRRWLTVLLCLLRAMVTVFLLVTGTRYLCIQVKLEEIFLNVAGLAIVMELDETFYAFFVPKPTQDVVDESPPLRRKTTSRTCPGGVPPRTAINITIAVVLAVVVGPQLLDLENDMERVKGDLCDGDIDVALGSHGPSGLLLAVKTKKYKDQASSDSLYANAFDSLLNASAEHRFAKDLDNARAAMWFKDRDMDEFALEVTDCEDRIFDASPDIAYLERAYGPGASCADYKDRCDSVLSPLLRWSCPVTCGCDAPTSGLLLKSGRFGCPEQVCLRKSFYAGDLAELPCEDLGVDELSASPQGPGFERLVRNFAYQIKFFEHNGARQTSNASYNRTAETLRLLELGCAGVPALLDAHRDLLCGQVNDEWASLEPFCPVACGCTQQRIGVDKHGVPLANEAVHRNRCPATCGAATRA